MKILNCVLFFVILTSILYLVSYSQVFALNNTLWHQSATFPEGLTIQGNAEYHDRFGYSLASGDFNKDGSEDLAIGAPGDSVGSKNFAGSVNVIYGGSAGLTADRDQIWHQFLEGVGGQNTGEGYAEAGDRFGYSLASGDFNKDGADDLAIGAPRDSVGTSKAAGLVNVIYGGSAGLTANGSQIWHQFKNGVGGQNTEGEAEAGDRFGHALTAGDFNKDGADDLAIGSPGDSVGTSKAAGVVNVIYGGSAGLTADRDQIWHQFKNGVGGQNTEGEAELNDNFGHALTAGDFNKDGADDLAIGSPGDSVGTSKAAGVVNVLYGSAMISGLTADRDQIWHQFKNGVGGQNTGEGLAESGDRFGHALTAGDFNKDGADDLAIGSPGDSVGTSKAAGVVNVLYGSAMISGLTADRDQIWHQFKNDVGGQNTEGEAESYDRFGYSLSSGDFNKDGADDLAIGAPWEDLGTASSREILSGSVNVIYGGSAGLTADRDQIWHQFKNGVGGQNTEGEAELNDNFGHALTAGDFNKDGADDLAIGVAGESIGPALRMAGAVNIIYSSGDGLAPN